MPQDDRCTRVRSTVDGSDGLLDKGRLYGFRRGGEISISNLAFSEQGVPYRVGWVSDMAIVALVKVDTVPAIIKPR